MNKLLTVLALTLALALPAGSAMAARDQIRIVGSSTVYPFSSAVAEEFGAKYKGKFKIPVVESTGSGGGHKLFGVGVGESTPDITNSSRPMKQGEFDAAKNAGVKGITEVKIGFDGIVIAQNKDDAPMALTLKDIALAVMEDVPQAGKLVKNPYKTWNEVNPQLPKRAIIFYGPPTTSGTRDAFTEMVLHVVTEKVNKDAGSEVYPKGYGKIRQDGPWVDSGENDNLIVQKLTKDKDAFGVFGYSFLEENQDKIQAASVDGVKPDSKTIGSFEYPIARSLWFYVKNDHVGLVPGLKEFVDLFMSEAMIGDRGQLKRIGLVPMPQPMREEWRAKAAALTPMTSVQKDMK